LPHFVGGPLRRFCVAAEVAPEGNGSHLVFTAEIECVGLLGMAARYSGMIGIEGRKRVAAVDRLVRDAAMPSRVLGESAADQITGGARRRLHELAAALAPDPLFLMKGPVQAGVTWQSEAIFQIGNPITHVDIPSAQNTTAIYAGAEVKGAAHAEAARLWLSFVRSPTALSIFERYGFKPLTRAEVAD
jgi:hypothetical protein